MKRPAKQTELDPDFLTVLNGFRSVVKLLRLADRAGIKEYGLGSAQVYVLHCLAQSEPLSINELADRTVTDQSSVSVVVNKLVDKGYVATARSTDDARRAALTLTAKGRRILRTIPPPFQQTLLDSLARLPRSKVRELGTTLNTLAEMMGVDSSRPPLFFEDGDDNGAARKRRRRTTRSR